jgi:hypothetical protein
MSRSTHLTTFVFVCLFLSRGAGTADAAPQPKGPAAKEDDKALELEINGQLADTDPNDPAIKMPSKIHTLKLPKGRTVQIDLKSNDFDAFLRILDVNDKELARDDDSGGGLNARILFPIPKSDVYKIVVTTFNGRVGNYQLLVKPIGELKTIKAKAPEIGKSTSIEDKLTNDDPVDPKARGPAKVYEIELAGAADYQLDLVSTKFDAYLRVLDKDGAELAYDDDSGGNRNARLVFAPPSTGTYRIVAATFDDKVGDYTLSIEAKKHIEPKTVKAKAPEAGKTVSIEDKLTTDDAKDAKVRGRSKIFEVELGKNDYKIDLVSTAFDSYLRVLDKNGKELAFDDDSGGNLNARLTFTPPSPGVYRIVAASFNTNVGDFTLSIENKK